MPNPLNKYSSHRQDKCHVRDTLHFKVQNLFFQGNFYHFLEKNKKKKKKKNVELCYHNLVTGAQIRPKYFYFANATLNIFVENAHFRNLIFPVYTAYFLALLEFTASLIMAKQT